MAGVKRNRLLVERAAPAAGEEPRGTGARAMRSVTVNLAESPLGWLRARGLISEQQFDAGERLRCDWERAQLAPSVTMRWDAPPIGKQARSAPRAIEPTLAGLDAKGRFEAAVAAAGPGLADIPKSSAGPTIHRSQHKMRKQVCRTRFVSA